MSVGLINLSRLAHIDSFCHHLITYLLYICNIHCISSLAQCVHCPMASHYGVTSVFLTPTRGIRIRYNNHAPVQDYEADVRRKFAMEEAKSFHIGCAHFLALFFPGIFISIVCWVMPKGIGRIIIDTSSKLCSDENGAPHIRIPKTGAIGMDNKSPQFFMDDNTTTRGMVVKLTDQTSTYRYTPTCRRHQRCI
jgi:hypothetical protein